MAVTYLWRRKIRTEQKQAAGGFTADSVEINISNVKQQASKNIILQVEALV